MPLPAPSTKLERGPTSAGSQKQQSTGIAPVVLQPKQDAPPPNTPVVVPSDAALFLRNLRLLDLDRLPDWPGATVDTFRVGKDVLVAQKDRVRAAEWVLYRLFEIWDPKETKNSLRQFFPSLEPLQSIKLRTALLQWLTSLKTNGVIGRECMIRKSVLDDCKGEKLEEVLLHFSTAVLRKMLRSHETKTNPASIAERLGSGRGWLVPEDSRVNPLLYAHESSLRSKRADQMKRDAKLRALETDFNGRLQTLQHEKESMVQGRSRLDARLKEAGVNSSALKKQLRHDCNGDGRWLNIAISGDAEHDRDAMVEDTFDKVWNNGLTTSQPVPYDPIPSSLLADLEDRVKHQRDRLNNWRTFQNQLSKRNEQFIVLQSPIKTPFKSPQKPRFGTAQSTPRRLPSTRKPVRSNQASLRLQALQSSPIKPPHPDLEAEHRELEQARGRVQPLGSPPDLVKKSSTLHQEQGSLPLEEEQFCEDLAALDLTSPPQKLYSAEAMPVRSSRLPSPSKSPVRRLQTSASIEPAANDAAPAHPGSRRSVETVEEAPLECSSHDPPSSAQPATHAIAAAPSREQDVSLLPTPPASSHETLSQRTQRTMADWQQKMNQPQASKSSGVPSSSPRLHRHTKSVPQRRLKSTPDSSPERIAKLSQRTTPHRSSTVQDSVPKLVPQYSEQENAPKTAIVEDSVSDVNRVTLMHEGPLSTLSPVAQPERVKPVTPPPAMEMADANMDDMSVFKPRNRLRRSPPNSPSPWD